ncbi:MAG: hypothetical protein BWY82_02280 [Verrucomicrobia bacterium ADurb.Bin474]|nr:MAG: hypothetical protein BWY82_02280 [Verrucomicrobia bacterium ADurb.Bin474]
MDHGTQLGPEIKDRIQPGVALAGQQCPGAHRILVWKALEPEAKHEFFAFPGVIQFFPCGL